MTATNQHETLVCIGGPLNAKRITVPFGLQWFTLKTPQVELSGALVAQHTPVPFEAIEEVLDFSTSSEFGSPADPEQIHAYVRTQFVTGERGLVHVLKFQGA